MSNAQQVYIDDMRRRLREKVSDPAALSKSQRYSVARRVALATQDLPSRSDYSRAELEALGRSMGDYRAFTTHPQAQAVWERSILSGAMNPGGLGASREFGRSVYSMSAAQQNAMIADFIGGATPGPTASAVAGTDTVQPEPEPEPEPEPAAGASGPTAPPSSSGEGFRLSDLFTLLGSMDRPGPAAEDDPSSAINARVSPPHMPPPVVMQTRQPTTTETGQSAAGGFPLLALLAAGAFFL